MALKVNAIKENDFESNEDDKVDSNFKLGKTNLDKENKEFLDTSDFIIKDKLENTPVQEQPEVINRIDRTRLAVMSPDSDFPSNKDGELALKAQVSIRDAQDFPEETQKKANRLEYDRTNLSPPLVNAINNNPRATGLLRPDFEKVNKVYEYLNQKEYLEGSLDDSLSEKLSSSLMKGMAIKDMAQYSNEVRNHLSSGQPLSKELLYNLDNLNFKAMAGVREGNLASMMLNATTNVLPPLLGSVENSIYRGATVGALGAVSGSIIPGAGTAVGAGAGFKVGASLGFIESTFNQTYVPAAISYSNLEVDGKKLDPSIVNTAATIEAVLSSTLDVASFTVLGSVFKGSARAVISSALASDSGIKIITELAKDIGKSTASEVFTEASQEVLFIAFGELAKLYTSKKREGSYTGSDVAQQVFSEDTMDSVIESGRQALLATPLLSGIPSSISAVARGIKLQKHIDDEVNSLESLEKVIDTIGGMSSLNTEDGRSVATETLAKTGNETVYMDTMEAQNVINSLKQDGITPENNKWIADIQDSVNEGDKAGRKASINTVDMIVNLKQDGGESFKNIIVTNEEYNSSKMRDSINKESIDSVQNDINEAIIEQNELNETAKLTQDILGQLKETGVLSSNAANLLSVLIPSWATTLSKTSELSPSQIISELGLKIEGAYKGFSEKDIDGANGIYDPNSRTITLGNSQDLSTFIHETAHFFFDAEQVLGDISRIQPILPFMSKELNLSEDSITQAFTDPVNNQKNYIEVQEFFARKFESYIMKGKAPSNELRTAFRDWRQWMLAIYKDSPIMGAELPSDVQSMFDQILVSQDITKSMVDDLMYQDKAKQIADNVSDLANARKKENVDLSEDELVQNSINRLFRLLKRKQTKGYEKDLREAKDQAKIDVDNDPLRIVSDSLKEYQIDRSEVKDILDAKRLPNKFRNMTTNDGFSINDVLELFEVDMTPSDFIHYINDRDSKAVAISNRTNEIMDSKTPKLTDEAIMDEAINAVRTSDRGRELLAGLNAVNDKLSKQRQTKNAIKQAALDQLYEMVVSNVKASIFHNREIKEAMAAKAAQVEGNIEFQQHHQANRVINFYMAKEATKIRSNYKKIENNLKKYKNRSVQGRIKKEGNGLWDRLSDILTTAGIIGKDVNAVELKDMTVGQMYALNDSVRSIEATARTINKVIVGNKKKALKETVSSIIKELDTNNPNIDLSYTLEDQNDKGARDFINHYLSNTKIIPWMLKTLSNPKGSSQSVMQLSLDRPLTLAMQDQNRLWIKHVQPIISAMEKNSDNLNKKMSSTHKIPTLDGNRMFNGKMTFNQIMSFALNLGTQNNIQTLLEGYGIIKNDEVASVEHPVVKDVLSNLSKKDWDSIKTIWSSVDSLFNPLSEIALQHKGIVLEKEEGNIIPTKYGDMKGGYYPLFKDNNVLLKSEEKGINHTREKPSTDDLMNGQSNNAAFIPSSTYERTKAVYPVSLDLNFAISSHFSEVLHYISHYDAIDSISKILSNDDFKHSYQKVAGKHELKSLQLWMKEVASPSVSLEATAMEDIVKRLKYGMTLAILGGSLFRTVPKQLFGFTNSANELGGANIIKAIRLLSSKSGGAAIQEMMDNSAIMSDRVTMKTFDRDINELKSDIAGNNKLLNKWNDLTMSPIGWMQNIVDTPTWIAAKNKSYDASMKKGLTDKQANKDAYVYADSIVQRTQGSSGQKNLAQMQRSQRNIFVKSITMFMTPINAILNSVYDIHRGAKTGNYSKAETARRVFYTLLVIPITSTLIDSGTKMFTDDDDDEEEKAIQEKFTHDLLGSSVGLLPLGNVLVNGIYGFKSNSNAPIETLARGVVGTFSLANETYMRVLDKENAKDEYSENSIEDVIILAASLLHVGGAQQIIKTGGSFIKEANEGFSNWERDNAAKIANELMYGKK